MPVLVPTEVLLVTPIFELSSSCWGATYGSSPAMSATDSLSPHSPCYGSTWSHGDKTQVVLDDRPPAKASRMESILVCVVYTYPAVLWAPYSFATTGWGLTPVIGLVTVLACHRSAIILAECLRNNPHIRSYPQLLQAVGGRCASQVVTALLWIEWFVYCTIFIVMIGENVHTSLGFVPGKWLMFATAMLAWPACLSSDMRFFSRMGSFGIVATVVIVALLWSYTFEVPPAATRIAESAANIPSSVGLMMLAFGGHTIIPSVSAQICDQSQMTSVIHWCYGVIGATFVVVGAVG